MNKVIILAIIGVIVVAVSAYPVEENDSSESKNNGKSQDQKVTPLLAAEKNTNDTGKVQDTGDDGNSTELAYVEETFIQVLIPGIPQLNATQLEALLNSTANDTITDNNLSRSSEENSSKLVSPEAEGQSSNSRSKRGAVDSKEVTLNNTTPQVESKPPAALFVHSAQNLYPSKDNEASVRHSERSNNNSRPARDVVDSSRKSTEAGPVVYATPQLRVNTAIPRVATASASPAARAETF